MDQVTLTRCDPDDPNRCQASHSTLQCPYLADEGSKYCARHGGKSGNKDKQLALRNYRLTRFRVRVEEKLSSPRVKSLTEEVGILRLTLEQVLENCQDDYELTLYSTKITELVSAIRATLEASIKIEEKSNLTLDKTQVMVVAERLIKIIGERISEEEMSEVADQIIKAFEVNDESV